MRYQEGTLFEVNAWTTTMGRPCTFVHLLRVSSVHSDNPSPGSIRVQYTLERVDENGHTIDDRTITFATERDDCPIPDSLNHVDSMEEAELDKERPRMEARCGSCGRDDADFIWVYDKLNNGRPNHTHGEPQCVECCFTYFDGASHNLPTELVNEVKRRVAEDEEDEQLENWAKRDSRIHSLDTDD